MPSHSENFPWPSFYGNYRYFEHAVWDHRATLVLTEESPGVYEYRRQIGDSLRVFICDCYSFGLAEYQEVIDEIGDVDVIVINSGWCGYTQQAKEHCKSQKVGLFRFGEFMGAMNMREYWNYVAPDDR